MSRYQQTISLLGLVTCLSTINAVTQPVLAQEHQIKETIKNSETEITNSQSFSTNAADLFANTDPAAEYQLAQGNVDLERFCQNYPYNSRCRNIPQNDTIEPEVETVPSPSRNRYDETREPKKSKSGWAIAPEVSTQGIGGSVIRRITPQLNARVGVNAFGLDFEIEDTDATYDGDLNLLNVSTLAEYYPFRSSGFRLSGGLVFGNNSIEGTATPNLNELGNEVIEIGDVEFNVSELTSVDAEVDITNSVSPYLGIGGGNPVSGSKGLGFWWNLGVMFGGSPDVTITPNIPEGVPQDTKDVINAEVEKETQEIEDDIDFISIYPVLSLGLSYQF
ncbi:MAG: hypothetical protein Tsb0014_10300 [Pleurocapsa sp.]